MRKVLLFLFMLFLGLSCTSYAAYEPPESDLILFADNDGGVINDMAASAKVPVFCLYKDGRLIYSKQDYTSGFVSLMETKLTQDKIDEILTFFANSDDWNENYDNCPISDVPVFNLEVKLGSGIKRFSVRGIDYCMKNKLIPQDLAKLYMYVSNYSPESYSDYSYNDIFLYVKQVEEPAKSHNLKIIPWKGRVDLASLVRDSAISGIAVTKISGKKAQSVVRDLKGLVPYNSNNLPVFFKFNGKYYSLAYRPLLPHETK